MARESIQCSTHGPSIATFVCKHIGRHKKGGFVFDTDSRDPWPDAVCKACAAEPSWTASQRIQVICAGCWEEAFEENLESPLRDEGEWLHAALHRAQVRQDRWTEHFGLNRHTEFDYRLGDGESWLAFADGGTFRVRADAHVIGSWGRSSGTWLWGWANDYWDASLTEKSVRVKRRGEREGVLSLARSALAADEDLAWRLAASALDTIPDLEGIYRCPGDKGSLFIGVTGTRLIS
jgi:hypothetical protein